MFDTRKFKVFAMVMQDGSVVRDVNNVKVWDLQNANFVVIADKATDEPHLEIWKDRFGSEGGPTSVEDAEAMIVDHVKTCKEHRS